MSYIIKTTRKTRARNINGKSGVIAGKMFTRGCHLITDELPSP